MFSHMTTHIAANLVEVASFDTPLDFPPAA
jgi:hypothetical protein